MRDRLPRSNRRADACIAIAVGEQSLIRTEMVRDFRPDDVDLDDLASAIGKLLESGDSDLLSRRRRVTHVVGGETA
jgi:hypothetical protein